MLSIFVLTSSEIRNSLHPGPGLWMSLWEALYKMRLDNPNYLQWPWMRHEVRLRKKGDWVEPEHGSSIREEMMAESILSVSTAKQNASSVRGGAPLLGPPETNASSSLQRTHSKCLQTQGPWPNPWGTQTYGTGFQTHCLVPPSRAGLPTEGNQKILSCSDGFERTSGKPPSCPWKLSKGLRRNP